MDERTEEQKKNDIFLELYYKTNTGEAGIVEEFDGFKTIKVERGYIVIKCIFCGTVMCIQNRHVSILLSAHLRNSYNHSCPIVKRLSGEAAIWKNIIARCNDVHSPIYPKYGGKGITVSGEWRTFEVFLADMGLKPSMDSVIGRKSAIGNYNKENCGWYIASKELVNGKPGMIRTPGIKAMALQTKYLFNNDWYVFWLVKYDYGRAPKVLRTEELQAPMTLLDGDFSFSVIEPAPESLVNKWLDKFGSKFGYRFTRQVDNGKAEYQQLEDAPLLAAVQPVDNKDIAVDSQG